uniref:Retrotransposon gag domain-containing protein n=1 Tax=Ananas comosus var. bracteatus TaxID=296719 RepID=A0A6V7PYC7_ANACO|nr:unnamed protein product [Ananas comosus var. bracteatus]
MPTTRFKFVAAENAANPEEVETSATSGSSEVRDLRSQLAILTDLVAQQAVAAQRQADVAHRQESRMKRLEDLLLQQAAAWEAQDSTPPAPVEDVAPRRRPPRPVFHERRLLLSLRRRFLWHQRLREKVDHWIVEKWLMHIEKLFHDTFVEKRDRVWFATHHLDGEAYRWWLDIRDNPNTDLSAISWKRFKELLLAKYFPESVKRKMEQDLRGLRQGDRTVAKYEWEFSRLLHCVPFVV